jgi:hypothetical protein
MNYVPTIRISLNVVKYPFSRGNDPPIPSELHAGAHATIRKIREARAVAGRTDMRGAMLPIRPVTCVPTIAVGVGATFHLRPRFRFRSRARRRFSRSWASMRATMAC